MRSLRGMSLNVNDDFNVVTVSFDANEKPPLAASSKEKILERYQRPDAGTRLALPHR